MKKVILMSIMALLVLFVVAPVMAAPATKTPFTVEATVFLGSISPGEEWITMGGIYHVKGQVGEGTVTGDISGEMLIVRDATVNLNTGKGKCHGKFVIIVEGVGTFEGSEQSTITDWGGGISGTLEGHGTGMFEGLKIMGSLEGGAIDTTVEAVLEGVILSPKG